MDEDNAFSGFEGALSGFHAGPVPQELWSDYAEGPFQTCTICSRELTEGVYEIQKVFTKRRIYLPEERPGKPRSTFRWETVLEMASCLRCSQTLSCEYSRQSMEAIRQFLLEHLTLGRPPELCNLCDEPFSVAPSFSAWAICSGNSLVLPVVHVCGKCEEKIQGLLSEKTRRAHDDFLERTFPGVSTDIDVAPRVFL